MPEALPNFSDAAEIAIDLETYDPRLTTHGSGWARKEGEIIGVAVAVDGESLYVPVRHKNGPNIDWRRVHYWLKTLCNNPNRDYVFHNAMYDVGWLWSEGIEIKGRIVDTMVAAPLIDENRYSYSLNALSKDYLGETKNEYLLKEAAAQFGVNPKAGMHYLPAQFVGPYAEQDAALTLRLWQHFKNIIAKDELEDIFNLELRVLRVCIEMRKKGVRVDVARAEQIKRDLEKREQTILNNLKIEYGVAVDIWAAASIAKAFDAVGLEYERTEKTNAPSFTKNFLANHQHALPRAVVQARELNKARTTFIDTILGHQHNGRIHAEMHQLRSDDGGTVTGRFSYSNPNLQQIPARNQEIGPLIRGLFLPEEGEMWGAFDYSSQEPRIVVHYASLLDFTGAADFVDQYAQNERTDFHQLAADIVGVPRKKAKDINLGLFYGMGQRKLADQLGLELEDAKELFTVYHNKVPFVRQLSDYAMNRANTRGVIRTLLGRRCRFDMWEPMKYGLHKPLRHADAYAEHGPQIKRAFTYKALNRLIQGSAADQTKLAMVTAYEAGYLPLIQVHDELDFSVASETDGRRIAEIMETCVELQVPSVVDAEFGTTWGNAKQTFSDKPWTRGLKHNHSEMETNNDHAAE